MTEVAEVEKPPLVKLLMNAVFEPEIVLFELSKLGRRPRGWLAQEPELFKLLVQFVDQKILVCALRLRSIGYDEL